MTGLLPVGFPHSDIRGSKAVRASPRLFAACRVLLRLREPRHPPCALWYLSRTAPVPPPSRARGTSEYPRSCILLLQVNCLSPAIQMAGSIDCLLFSCVFPHPFKEPLSAASLRMRPCRSGGVGPPPPERRPPSGEGVERQHVRDVARTSVHWNGLTAKTSRKEVFQPHLPVRLPCYDLAPVTEFALGRGGPPRAPPPRERGSEDETAKTRLGHFFCRSDSL